MVFSLSLTSSFFFICLLHYNPLQSYLTIWLYLFNSAFGILRLGLTPYPGLILNLLCRPDWLPTFDNHSYLTSWLSGLYSWVAITTWRVVFIFIHFHRTHCNIFHCNFSWPQFLKLQRIQLLKFISFKLSHVQHLISFRWLLVVSVDALVWQWLIQLCSSVTYCILCLTLSLGK